MERARARRRMANRMPTIRPTSSDLMVLRRELPDERACPLLRQPTSSARIAQCQLQTPWNQVLNLLPTLNSLNLLLRLPSSLVLLSLLRCQPDTPHTRPDPLNLTGTTVSLTFFSARMRLRPRIELFSSANHADLSMAKLPLEPRRFPRSGNGGACPAVLSTERSTRESAS